MVEENLQVPVPEPDAPWLDLWQFALTYNAYERHGGSDPVAKLGNAAVAEWEDNRRLPEGLEELRCALFFEQRRFHHFGTDPEGAQATYVRALLAAIRDRGGSVLEGPADEPP